MKHELATALDPDASPEQKEATKEKITVLKTRYKNMLKDEKISKQNLARKAPSWKEK